LVNDKLIIVLDEFDCFWLHILFQGRLSFFKREILFSITNRFQLLKNGITGFKLPI